VLLTATTAAHAGKFGFARDRSTQDPHRGAEELRLAILHPDIVPGSVDPVRRLSDLCPRRGENASNKASPCGTDSIGNGQANEQALAHSSGIQPNKAEIANLFFASPFGPEAL
jgi:hypothetical protein